MCISGLDVLITSYDFEIKIFINALVKNGRTFNYLYQVKECSHFISSLYSVMEECLYLLGMANFHLWKCYYMLIKACLHMTKHYVNVDIVFIVYIMNFIELLHWTSLPLWPKHKSLSYVLLSTSS